jgi:hypothetical protein
MQYGELISRSFRIMWSHRYLWLLAILLGSDVGGGISPGSNLGQIGNFTTGPRSGQQAGTYLQDNLGLIIGLMVLGLLVVVGVFLLSCVTTGALIRGSAEHDAERPFRAGLAWRAGARTFWSILGLRMIGFVLFLLALLVVAAFVLLGVAAYLNSQPGLLAAVIAIGIVVFLAVIVLWVAIGIVFILATRAIVLEERGAVAALRRALQLFRARLGRVLLVWLIQVGLGIGIGFAVGVASLPVLLLAAALVAGGAFAGGLVVGLVVGIPVGLVVTAALLVVAAMAGTFLSTYWTLAFRRMELDIPAPQPAWPPGAYPPPAG